MGIDSRTSNVAKSFVCIANVLAGANIFVSLYVLAKSLAKLEFALKLACKLTIGVALGLGAKISTGRSTAVFFRSWWH